MKAIEARNRAHVALEVSHAEHRFFRCERFREGEVVTGEADGDARGLRPERRNGDAMAPRLLGENQATFRNVPVWAQAATNLPSA